MPLHQLKSPHQCIFKTLLFGSFCFLLKYNLPLMNFCFSTLQLTLTGGMSHSTLLTSQVSSKLSVMPPGSFLLTLATHWLPSMESTLTKSTGWSSQWLLFRVIGSLSHRADTTAWILQLKRIWDSKPIRNTYLWHPRELQLETTAQTQQLVLKYETVPYQESETHCNSGILKKSKLVP